MNVLVIGCGVSGLTTGIRLLEEKFTVTILARDLPPNTTSDKAGAIWFPYRAYPLNKVSKWSKISYKKFQALSGLADSGISMIACLLLFDKKLRQPPWWVKLLPKGNVRRASRHELPSGYHDGYAADVPLIETPIYLPFLMNYFQKLGGQILQGEVTNLKTFVSAQRLTVNCTGLEARHLVGDEELYPIQGHIVKVKTEGAVRCLADDDGHNALAYIIPRRDGCILGGTAAENDWGTGVKMEVVESIRRKCAILEPALNSATFLDAYVGLRPGRKQVRLELEKLALNKMVIHNYGHGGSGFTISWGCAEEVVALAQMVRDDD